MKSMINSLKSKLIASFLVFMLFTPAVFATDGYFGVGYDTKSKGMGGAGVALFQNSFFGNSNPAAMVMHGNKYGASVGLFNPNRNYNIIGEPTPPSSWTPNQQAGLADPPFGFVAGEVESDSKLFPMPSMVANWMINVNSSFSISLYGNGGMNTNYPAKTFLSPYFPAEMGAMVSSTTGVNLMQMFGGFTYSVKLGEKWSAGFSGIIAWQSFEVKGLQLFGNMSSDATKLTNNGANSSFGFGGKIGIQGEVTDGLFFGATFQTKMFMEEFDNYSGLYAENGDFDIPGTWTLGLAYELVPDKFTVAFDVKQICYNKIKSIGTRMMDATGPLGAETGAGFGWQNMTVWKFGFEYAANEDWTLRTGFSHGKNPVRSTDVMFNILAPGVIDNHITFGFSKMMGSKELNVAIVHALRNDVTGPNPMDPAQTIDLSMAQWELEIGITF